MTREEGKKDDSEHVETLFAMAKLTDAYSLDGKLKEAVTIVEDLLEIRKRALGPEPPTTLTDIEYLANLYIQLNSTK